MGDVWDRSVECLGENLSVVLPIAIVGIFVPLSVAGALGAQWATATQATRLLLAPGFLLLYLAVFWAYLAITAVVLDPSQGARAWREGARRLPAGIGSYLLFIIALLVLSIPIGVLLGLSGIDMEAAARGEPAKPTSIGAVWGMLLYGLAMMIAILFVTARILPLGGVIVAERRGAGALKRAWQMTRGLSWRLVGVLLLYLIVAQVAALAAETVFGSILRLFTSGDGTLDVATVVTAIIVAAVQTVLSLLAAIFSATLYAALSRETPRDYHGEGVARA